VAVSPSEGEGIVADPFDITQFLVAPGLEANRARVPLATRARTITPQYFMGIDHDLAVGPGDFEASGAVRGLDGGRFELWFHAKKRVLRGGSGLAKPPRVCHTHGPLANTSESVQCRPLEVQVGDKGIERAIKHLKRKMAAEGILRELKRRRHYMKPSIKKRKKMSEAARRRRKRLKTDEIPRTMG